MKCRSFVMVVLKALLNRETGLPLKLGTRRWYAYPMTTVGSQLCLSTQLKHIFKLLNEWELGTSPSFNKENKARILQSSSRSLLIKLN